MSVLGTPPAAAADKPGDSHIRAALYDIGRAESQAAGLTSGNKAKIARIRRSLETAAAQLKASGNRSDASWVAANDRLERLVRRLAEIGNGAGKSTAATSTGTTTKAPPKNSGTGSTAGLDRYDTEQLATISRQTDSLIKQLQAVSEVDLQRPEVAARWQAQVQRLKDLYMKLSRPKHPDALPVAQKILAVERHLTAAIERAASATAALGDVKATIAAIEERSRTLRVPHAPTLPAPVEAIRTYAGTLNKIEKTVRADLATLQSLKGKTSLVLPSTLDGLAHWAKRILESDLPRHRKQVVERLDTAIRQPEWRIKFVEETDPANPDHQKNRLLGADERKETLTAFRDAIALIALAGEFEKAAGIAPKDRTEIEKTYRRTIASFEAKYVAALDVVRFPEIRSKDAALLEAAKTVLGDPRNKVGEILRVEITSAKRRHNRTEIHASGGEATATKYVWDEFSVTTAERIDGEVHLFHNLIKFFHKGGSDVPVGRWTLGKRFRGNRILEKNLFI